MTEHCEECGLPDNCGDCDHTSTNAYVADRAKMSPESFAMFYDGQWLSDYALDCGYVERYETHDPNQWITLWKEGCYHVRHTNFDSHERIFWDSFDTIEEARDRLATAINRTKEINA